MQNKRSKGKRSDKEGNCIHAHGTAWKLMELYVRSWNFKYLLNETFQSDKSWFLMLFESSSLSHSVTRALWASMQLHKLACSFIGFLAVLWACMQLHVFASSLMSLHAVPYFFVGAAHKNFTELVSVHPLMISVSTPGI